MNKTILVLFSLLIFSGIGTAQETNLLNNSAWTFYTDGKAIWTYTGDTNSIDIIKAGNNTQLYQSGIILEPNSVYQIHFTAINAFVDRYEQMSIAILQHKAPYKVYFKAIVPLPVVYTDAPDFKVPEYTYTFKTPAKVDNNIRFMYYFNYAKAGDNYNIGVSPTLIKVE